MPACPHCAEQLDPDWKFCVSCGAPTIPGAIRPVGVAPPRFNRLAIVALVLACISGPIALITGHIATAQIARSGERGKTMATVAIVLGYVWLAFGIGVLGYLNARH